MPSTLTVTYTYEGKEGDLAIIDGKGTVETTDKEAWVQNSGMEMKFNLSGTTASKIKMDQKSGWVSEAVIVQEMEGETQIKANDQMPEDMTIPMTIKNETGVTNE